MSSNAGREARKIGPSWLRTRAPHRDQDHEGQQRDRVRRRCPRPAAVAVRSPRIPACQRKVKPTPRAAASPTAPSTTAERLVLPLVDVVHVDDVDGGDDDRGGDEGEGQEAERTGDDRDQDAEADRPAVGLGRRATGQRHQRRDQVEAVDRLPRLERERLTALGATGAELGPGHGVEPSSWRGDGRHGAATAHGGGLRGAGHRCPPCEVLLEGASAIRVGHRTVSVDERRGEVAGQVDDADAHLERRAGGELGIGDLGLLVDRDRLARQLQLEASAGRHDEVGRQRPPVLDGDAGLAALADVGDRDALDLALAGEQHLDLDIGLAAVGCRVRAPGTSRTTRRTGPGRPPTPGPSSCRSPGWSSRSPRRPGPDPGHRSSGTPAGRRRGPACRPSPCRPASRTRRRRPRPPTPAGPRSGSRRGRSR